MKLRDVIRSPEVRRAVAESLAAAAREHLVRGYGRGPGGSQSLFTPLAIVTGRDARGRLHRSYRDGGKPLYDTGALARSISARSEATASGFAVTLRGLGYGEGHETGFRTAGPNYIPLTQRGARRHATGANPEGEELDRGADFIMAWRGVTVPARPWMRPTKDDMRDFATTLRIGLARALGAR